MGIFSMGGMGGLVKANLSVYFDSIKRGINHEDALMTCLKSRYPFEPNKLREVMIKWHGYKANDTGKDELRDLIYIMYSVETHLDIDDRFRRIKALEIFWKFDEKFNELYDSVKAKYLK